jgi:hypothetical protein
MAFRALSQTRAIVVAALVARWNDAAQEAADHYGIDAGILTLDFSTEAGQFYEADIDPAQLEDSAPAAYPYCMVYLEGAADNADEFKGLLKMRGSVDVVVDFHMSVTGNRYLAQLESISDAALEALVEVLGDPAMPYAGGRINAIKEPTLMAGDDWMKTVRLRLNIAAEG